MKTKLKRFTFRVPEEIYTQIEEIAKSNFRSVNAEIIVAIEKYISSQREITNSQYSQNNK